MYALKKKGRKSNYVCNFQSNDKVLIWKVQIGLGAS